MKSSLQISFLLFVITLITSCVTTYKIDESEYDLIPYKGNELLVFESTQKEIDTIILKKYNGWYKTKKVPYRIFHNRYQKYGIELIHPKSNISNYTSDFLIEISAFNWKGLRIDVRVKSDNYIYRNKTVFTKLEFDNIPSQQIRINEILYTDVKIILGDNTKNKVKHFYWSKKHGLLGWDNDKTKWRLKEIQSYN